MKLLLARAILKSLSTNERRRPAEIRRSIFQQNELLLHILYYEDSSNTQEGLDILCAICITRTRRAVLAAVVALPWRQRLETEC